MDAIGNLNLSIRLQRFLFRICKIIHSISFSLYTCVMLVYEVHFPLVVKHVLHIRINLMRQLMWRICRHFELTHLLHVRILNAYNSHLYLCLYTNHKCRILNIVFILRYIAFLFEQSSNFVSIEHSMLNIDRLQEIWI